MIEGATIVEAPRNPAAIELADVTKRFGPVVANQDITFDARYGEVHALKRPRLPECLHEALGLDHQVSCHAPSLRGPADTALTRHRHGLTSGARVRAAGARTATPTVGGTIC